MVSFWSSTIELISICFGISLITILTVGGNLVVLFAFYTDRHLLTPSNHFLLSMAIADLLVGLVAMPFYSYAQIKNFWPFGKLFCKIWLTIDDVATMASVLSIVAITIERYWSINHSVHYRRHTTKTRIRLFSVLIWLIPLLNFAPGIWFLESKEDLQIGNMTRKNISECIGAYHSYTFYLIIAQINFFAWPLVVIVILNILIVLNLYQRSRYFPSYDSYTEKRKFISKLTELQEQEKKNDELLSKQIIEHDEATVSLINKTACHTSKKKDLQDKEGNRCGSIRSVIKEVDELMIEDDNHRCQLSEPIPMSFSDDIETKLSSSPSSKFCRNFKHIFQINSTKSRSSLSSKSTQTFHSSTQQKRCSIFGWRTSSFRLSRGNTNSGEQRTNRRLRRDKRAATSLLILVLVFMIFLLPYVVVVVVGNLFSVNFLIDTNGQVYSAAFWLLWLNSTVNPIIYPFIQPKFRDAYRKIFQRLIRRRRRLVSLIGDIQRENK